MLATITHHSETYTIDLSKPHDISLPLRGDPSNVTAWDVNPPIISPHTDGKFIGKVSEGASVNFNDISFNPHAHGTHTECIGHITNEFISVNKSLNLYFFIAELISLTPEKYGDDLMITGRQMEDSLHNRECEAVVIRTLPNSTDKVSRQYSNTNPPYLQESAALFLRDRGLAHLLVDLPSVDKEKDGGALLAHKAFWDFDGKRRTHATITELLYIADTIPDGTYILNLQMAPFENDASPSRPVLYTIVRE